MTGWRSLSDQVALATQMFGDRGPGLVDVWLAEQLARIDDPDFAEGFAAHGYAAAAQRTWAKVVADEPGCLLIGTIDRLNGASRLTAERAGRPPILEAVFVLPGT